jgi:hypothetical protein
MKMERAGKRKERRKGKGEVLIEREKNTRKKESAGKKRKKK